MELDPPLAVDVSVGGLARGEVILKPRGVRVDALQMRTWAGVAAACLLLCTLGSSAATARADGCAGSSTATCPYSSVGAVGGIASGELRTPSGVAVDGAGDIHVLDAADARVQLYDSAGRFVRTIFSWYADGPHAPPGWTTAIAADAAGDTYATSYGVIYELSSIGVVLRTFTVPASLSAFPPGDCCDRAVLTGVAVDQQTGHVYGVFFDKQLVLEFAADGTLVRSWPFTPAGSHGPTHDDQIAAGGGSVYLLDDDLVTRFDATGTERSSWQVASSNGIAADAQGNAYVAQDSTGATAEFDPTGHALTVYGSPEPASLARRGDVVIAAADGVGVSSAGVFVSDSRTDQVRQFAFDGTLLATTGGHQLGELSQPVGVVSGPDGSAVYVADWNSDAILQFDQAGRFVRVFAKLPDSPGAPFYPLALARSGNGDIYALGVAGVARFDASGALLAAWQSAGFPAGPFYDPFAVSPAGDVYLASIDSPLITEYSPDGTPLRTIGAGTLTSPTALAADAAGNVWVYDEGAQRIDEFAPTGAVVGQSPYDASYPSPAYDCSSMAFDRAGDLALGCAGGIVVLDPTGLRGVGWSMSGPHLNEYFNEPSQVAIDDAGRVYVAEPNNDVIQIFGLRGPLSQIDGPSAAIVENLLPPLPPGTIVPTAVAVPGPAAADALPALPGLPARGALTARSASVTLACRGALPCRGTLTLLGSARATTLGRARVAIRPRHSLRIAIPLSRAGRRAVAGRKRLRARVRVVLGSHVSTRSITLTRGTGLGR